MSTYQRYFTRCDQLTLNIHSCAPLIKRGHTVPIPSTSVHLSKISFLLPGNQFLNLTNPSKDYRIYSTNRVIPLSCIFFGMETTVSFPGLRCIYWKIIEKDIEKTNGITLEPLMINFNLIYQLPN